MLLRKITNDNSVRYIPITEKTKQKRLPQKTEKPVHVLVNKTKLFQRTLSKSLKM